MINADSATNASPQSQHISHRRSKPGAEQIVGVEKMDQGGSSSLFTLALIIGILGVVGFFLVAAAAAAGG